MSHVQDQTHLVLFKQVMTVTVTVRTREGGNYQCTVSNARVQDGTINGITATEGGSLLTISGQ